MQYYTNRLGINIFCSGSFFLSVKIHSLVCGNTLDAHRSILRLVQPVNESSLEDCRVILVFCPIATRAGTDIGAAIQKIPGRFRWSLSQSQNPDHKNSKEGSSKNKVQNPEKKVKRQKARSETNEAVVIHGKPNKQTKFLFQVWNLLKSGCAEVRGRPSFI